MALVTYALSVLVRCAAVTFVKKLWFADANQLKPGNCLLHGHAYALNVSVQMQAQFGAVIDQTCQDVSEKVITRDVCMSVSVCLLLHTY